jgi:ubiquinone/menaquinone biosynthesis C-methylase UbiE
MSERYTEEWVAGLLDGAERFGESDPAQMLRELGVSAGSTVVDYGCGPGLFTLAAARLVRAAGKVYGVDLEPRMVELVVRRAQDAGLTNVTAVASDGTRAALPDSVADFIVCVQIMHYQPTREQRVAVARDLYRLLKADGRVMIMQWRPKRGASGVSYRALATIMRDAGLVTDGARTVTDVLYRTLATKAPAGRAGGVHR